MIKKYQAQSSVSRFIKWYVATKPTSGTIIEVGQSVLDDELMDMFKLSTSALFPIGEWNGHPINVVPDFRGKTIKEKNGN